MFVIGGWLKRVLGTGVCITGTAHREGRCIQLWSCGLGADQRSQQLWPPPALRYSIPSWLGKFPHTVDFLLNVLHFTFNSIHFTYQENKRMTCKNFNDIMNFHFVLKFHENFIIQFVMVFSLHPHSFVYISKKRSNLFEVEKNDWNADLGLTQEEDAEGCYWPVLSRGSMLLRRRCNEGGYYCIAMHSIRCYEATHNESHRGNVI